MSEYRNPGDCPWCGDPHCGGDKWADGCDGPAANQRREYNNPIPIDPNSKQKTSRYDYDSY